MAINRHIQNFTELETLPGHYLNLLPQKQLGKQFFCTKFSIFPAVYTGQFLIAQALEPLSKMSRMILIWKIRKKELSEVVYKVGVILNNKQQLGV